MEYKMPKDVLEEVSDRYNRSKNQCQFLFNLLEGDMELYLELESALKQLYYGFYVPGDLNDCNYVLARYRVLNYINLLYKKALES